MDYSDYDTDLDEPRHPRADEDWDGVWGTDDRPRERPYAAGLAITLVVAAATFAILRTGWRRMPSGPNSFVPSAADIFVRPPPPR